MAEAVGMGDKNAYNDAIKRFVGRLPSSRAVYLAMAGRQRCQRSIIPFLRYVEQSTVDASCYNKIVAVRSLGLRYVAIGVCR